jgi:arsenate reductase
MLLMNLLFLCVANSARSQMAEGLAKKILGKGVRVQSAGSFPTFLHPLALQVLYEIDIDIADQHSKSVNEIDPRTVDTVITLCAEEVCPIFLGDAKRLHWPLPDPASVEESKRADAFRAVRDELRKRLEALAKAH